VLQARDREGAGWRGAWCRVRNAKRAAQSSEVIPSTGLLVQGGGDAVQSDLEGVRAEAFDGDEHGERGDEGG
jgi:hypothetical protein